MQLTSDIVRPSRRRRRMRADAGDTLTLSQSRQLQQVKQKFAHLKGHMAEMVSFACRQKILHNDDVYLDFITELEHPPVDIETFLDSPDYFGACGVEIWPEVRRALTGISKDWYKGERHGAVSEVLNMGATGSGKSIISMVTMLYHLYLTLCLRDPQGLYSLSKQTSIVFILQSAKPHVTKKVLYAPFRAYVETIPWFQRNAPPSKYIEAELLFPDKNVRVVPATGDSDALLGEAVSSILLDEINYFSVVQRSKKVMDGSARGGTYDQAQTIFNAVTRRREGRYRYNGPRIGILSFSSSARYRKDFTERRLAALKGNGFKNAYLYNKTQYDAQPSENFCGDIFNVVIHNDAASDIELIEHSDEVGENGLRPQERKLPTDARVLEVPVEYLKLFKEDAAGALRDVCGISSVSIQPFFRERSKISEAVERGEQSGLESILVKDNVILGLDGMPSVRSGVHCRNPSKPRYVHIDLAINGDRAAICMVRFDGMREVERTNGVMETLPDATMEFCCTIEPDHASEIDLGEIRAWILGLRNERRYPIRAITYDGYQSVDSKQILRKQGFKVGTLSVDRSTGPYRALREALSDGRLRMYQQDVLIQEMTELEHDDSNNRDKIDHAPNSGKDASDALCGAYYLLLQRASSWQTDGDDDRDSDSAREDIERY